MGQVRLLVTMSMGVFKDLIIVCLGGVMFINFNSHDVEHVCKYGLDS